MIDKTKMTALEYREWVGKHLNLNKEILQLTQEEVKSLGMSDEELCEHVRRSMADYAAGKTEMPAKIGIHPLHDTFFHAQPADYPDEYACGIKWGACYPANRERFGMPQTTSLYVYNERESGCPLCLMDAVWITENRTAAVAAVSAMAMANTKAKTFGMIGCGVQGKAQVRFMQLALPELEEIYIYDAFEPAMDALIELLQPTTKAKIIKSNFEEIAKKCEVIASAAVILETPDPQFKDEWFFKKGQTIISSDCHTWYEQDTIMSADKYYQDSKDQHVLLKNVGTYYPGDFPEQTWETGEAFCGLKPGRENEDEFIIVNNVGLGIEDVIVAARLFEAALEKGIGRKIPL